MYRRLPWLLFITLLASACTITARQTEKERAAIYNAKACDWRYTNIDSSLHYARMALQASPSHSRVHAAAICNMAYVAYQQMSFKQATHLLQDVYHNTPDQIELLCADVMAMKVAQRTGNGYAFFNSRNHALKRISRIQEEEEYLSQEQKRRFHFALTELHIVSSTYYYYLGQDSAARKEIHSIDDVVSLERDTTQWIYYHYMLGSGGLLTGQPSDVLMQEFHHLLNAYTVARATRCVYFEANCLQALASMFADTAQAAIIRTREPESYGYLRARFMPADDGYVTDAEPQAGMPLNMAFHAMQLFRGYKDKYQTACAYRTIGEIYFMHEQPQLALTYFQKALSLVQQQMHRDSTIIEPWMAGIHEKLSMAYSALHDKASSDMHRNAYLDLLDQSRQNKELDSRKDMLAQEVNAIHIKLLMLFLLLGVVTILCAFYARNLRKHTLLRYNNLQNIRQSPSYQELCLAQKECHGKWQDYCEEQEQECRASAFHTQELIQGNLERRAKVSLVYAIVPYLDRMLAEVKRMREGGASTPDQLHYIGELAEEIMRINALLTEWIQVQRGQLSLHVSTFPLADVLHVISLGSHAYSQKGITLEVDDTDVKVKADKALTMFMANTLADNARKFTPSGGKVSLKVASTDEYVEVSIQDTGEGLSPDDVYTLNHSKVYNPQEIGSHSAGKGFGFGIMNCRGIIEKYKKTSAYFHVCAFGVESEQGRGSRFWFRLPRVLAVCVAFLGSVACMNAQEAVTEQLFDSVYMANVHGQYAKAYSMAEQATQHLQAPIDTALLISLRNEMAISALALRRWSDYRWQNNECVRLHRLYSQDSSLAVYCQQMEKISFDTYVFYVIMSVLSVVAVVLFYLLFLRGRLRSRKHYDQVAQCLHTAQQSLATFFTAYTPEGMHGQRPLPSCDQQDQLLAQLHHTITSLLPDGGTLTQLASDLHHEAISRTAQARDDQAQASTLNEQLEKCRFEENRLYVMNQILDNSLSTIKHETMYYPARTRQMVATMDEDGCTAHDIDELHDLLQSYRQVYMLLYEQASHQTEQRPLQRRPVELQPLFSHLSQRMSRMRIADGGERTLFTAHDTSLVALADEALLHTLLTSLATPLMGQCQSVELQAEPSDADRILIQYTCQGHTPSDVAPDELFTPAARCFPFLVARQAVRETDASFGHPGLRLTAEPAPGGFRITCTLMRCLTNR